LVGGGDGPELLLGSTAARDATITRAAARALTSLHTVELKTALGRHASLCAAPPGVDPKDLAHLDARGVVKEGVECAPGMVLAATAAPDGKDRSLRCFAWARGTVSSVAVDPAEVRITLTHERPVAVGDVLRTEGGAVAVVGAIVDALPAAAGTGDVLWPAVEGRMRVAKVACAEDVLEARFIGPYSIVTCQPLAGRAHLGGQRVTRAAVDALLARGARTTVFAMLTIQSDDIKGRVALYEAIAGRGGAPDTNSLRTTPEATRVLERELLAIGFQVDFTHDAPSLALATTATVRALSSGEVRKPDTLNYRTFTPEPGGLFCETIFGPVHAKGLEVGKGLHRRTRLGHIELPFPLLHPWAVRTVADLLDRSEKEVWAILEAEPDAECVPGVVRLRQALEETDIGVLALLGGRSAEAARALKAAGLHPAELTLEAWPVLPPDLRPLIPLAGGRFATSDLNDLYRRLINRANRTRRLIELQAPAIILFNEVRMLQEALVSLVENGLRGRAVRGPQKRPLKSLCDMVGGNEGRFQYLQKGKRVDYSGAAVVVERAELAPDRALLPSAAAKELFKPWVYHALTHGQAPLKAAKKLVEQQHPTALHALREVMAKRPLLLVTRGDAPRVASVDCELWEQQALGLSPAMIHELGLHAGDVVSLHVPTTIEAADEVRALRGRTTAVPSVVDDGWISRAAAASKAAIGSVLYGAALRCERDEARSTTARLVLGRAL
jgi:hypothetical protein